MRILLMIWIVIGGVDRGPPPIPMPSIEACKAKEAELLAKPVPEGVDFVSVGCVTERKPETAT